MTKGAENLRKLIKDLLNGKSKPDELLKYLQLEKEDLSLLTQAERAALEDYNQRYAGSTFESFSMEDLFLYSLIRYKAKVEAPRRHLLDRVDLTTVTGEEAETAYQVTNQPWVKQFDVPEWLEE